MAAADGRPSWGDFASEAFDPLRALYDPHCVPPVPSAAPLDSVTRCAALLPEALLPPKLALTLRKRFEESDMGVRAQAKALVSERTAAARAARTERLDRFSLLRSMLPQQGAIPMLQRWADDTASVGIVLRGCDADQGPTVAVGRLLAVDVHGNLVIAGYRDSRRWLSSGAAAATSSSLSSSSSSLGAAFRVDLATGAISSDALSEATHHAQAAVVASNTLSRHESVAACASRLGGPGRLSEAQSLVSGADVVMVWRLTESSGQASGVRDREEEDDDE